MAIIQNRFCRLTRELFEEQLNNGGFEKYSIVFIPDELLIWNNGIFYGLSEEDAKRMVMYQSQLPDDLTTPSKHGGLAGGISVATLKKKSLSQIFDDILFEELLPSVNNPSCSISPKGSWVTNGIYEVGSLAPSSDNFNTGFNRGLCTVVGQPNKYRAGVEISRSITYNNNAVLDNAKIVLGSMQYKLTVNYALGDELVTSKGNIASVRPNPLPAGSVSATTTIYGTYPYFCNGASASSNTQDTNLPSLATPNTKLPLIKWTDTLIGAKFASEASTGVRLEFHFPSSKNVTKVEFFNTVSGKWELFASNNYIISNIGNKQIQGLDVQYKKLTTSGNLLGALQLRFTLSNVSRNIPYKEVLRDSSTSKNTPSRPRGVANFSVNFEPGGQSPLDARSLVPTKEYLIATETYSAKNYYNGMMVVVANDGGKPSLYVLKDYTKITAADYSGWLRIDVGALKFIEVVNDLTTGGIDKALSAEQGKVLKTEVDTKITKELQGDSAVLLIRYDNPAYPHIKNIQDALNLILYVNLSISLSCSPNTAETGETVNSLNFRWSYNKNNITFLRFDNLELDLSIRNYTIEGPIKNNTSKTLVASDGTKLVSSSAGISFIKGVYYGVAAKNDITMNDILKFTRRLQSSRSMTITVNAAGNDYIYICIPYDYGAATFKVGGFEGGFTLLNDNFQFNKYTPLRYRIYKSDNKGLGNTTITVS